MNLLARYLDRVGRVDDVVLEVEIVEYPLEQRERRLHLD